jgi:hypothetical protein
MRQVTAYQAGASPERDLVRRSGPPSGSFTNQSGCSRNSLDPASATNGATQIAGSKPRSRMARSTDWTSPPNAGPVSSQSPMAGW